MYGPLKSGLLESPMAWLTLCLVVSNVLLCGYRVFDIVE